MKFCHENFSSSPQRELNWESYHAIADQHFNGSLVGRILLTTGHGGVCIDVDVNETIIDKRIKIGFTDIKVENLDAAIEMAQQAAAEKKTLAIGVVGNAATLFWEAYDKGFEPDIVTEMCPCHDPFSYIPEGFTPTEAEDFRVADRDRYLETAEGHGKLTSESIKVPLWWSPVATFGPEGGRQLRRSAHTKE
ncbi:MAG: hypothetical protein U9Q05_09195 [Thermodesulfobacteriota bacterium]|nr:hypothetical protein [Thermodesulfobacteriota bacterium]